MHSVSLLPADLSAQTPPEVLAIVECLQLENERLRMQATRLEALVAQCQQRASSPVTSPGAHSYPVSGRRSRSRSWRKWGRVLKVVLLLALALGGGALIAWSVATTANSAQ